MVSVIIQRYGRKQSELDRGGIWATIIHDDIENEHDEIYKKLHRYSGQYHYGLIDVLKPFFVDTANLNENQYPLALYGLLTGMRRKIIGDIYDTDYIDDISDFYGQLVKECLYAKELGYNSYDSCMEHKYAEVEKACSYILERKGYDGAIFVNMRVFTQVFYTGSQLYIHWFD